MKRLQPGTPTPDFQLQGIDGHLFDSASLRGERSLISFYRFASCPFCNLRMHEVIRRLPELEGRLDVVAIFDSPLKSLRKHASGHHSPFPVLADPGRSIYQRFRIEHSMAGMLKGMILRMPTLLRAMFAHGYWPVHMDGSITSMPADFLVDENGITQTAHYGADEGDHLPWDTIAAFALGSESTPPTPASFVHQSAE